MMAAVSIGLLAGSCVSSGTLASIHTTQVQLSEANYKVVASAVTGEAKSRYIIGVTIGLGMSSHVFALFPLEQERSLYKMAIQNLWKNFEAKHGSVEGRTLALVNLRYDTEGLNLLVYTSPKLTLVADVVEFTK